MGLVASGLLVASIGLIFATGVNDFVAPSLAQIRAHLAEQAWKVQLSGGLMRLAAIALLIFGIALHRRLRSVKGGADGGADGPALLALAGSAAASAVLVSATVFGPQLLHLSGEVPDVSKDLLHALFELGTGALILPLAPLSAAMAATAVGAHRNGSLPRWIGAASWGAAAVGVLLVLTEYWLLMPLGVLAFVAWPALVSVAILRAPRASP